MVTIWVPSIGLSNRGSRPKRISPYHMVHESIVQPGCVYFHNNTSRVNALNPIVIPVVSQYSSTLRYIYYDRYHSVLLSRCSVYVWGHVDTAFGYHLGMRQYSVGPVIRNQDFQIARRFLKTDVFLGEGKSSPRPLPRALRANESI